MSEPIVMAEPISNGPGSVLHVQRGRVRETVGGIDRNDILIGWYWFTYDSNTLGIPCRNSCNDKVRYADERECTEAALAFIRAALNGGHDR